MQTYSSQLFWLLEYAKYHFRMSPKFPLDAEEVVAAHQLKSRHQWFRDFCLEKTLQDPTCDIALTIKSSNIEYWVDAWTFEHYWSVKYPHTIPKSTNLSNKTFVMPSPAANPTIPPNHPSYPQERNCQEGLDFGVPQEPLFPEWEPKVGWSKDTGLPTGALVVLHPQAFANIASPEADLRVLHDLGKKVEFRGVSIRIERVDQGKTAPWVVAWTEPSWDILRMTNNRAKINLKERCKATLNGIYLYLKSCRLDRNGEGEKMNIIKFFEDNGGYNKKFFTPEYLRQYRQEVDDDYRYPPWSVYSRSFIASRCGTGGLPQLAEGGPRLCWTNDGARSNGSTLVPQSADIESSSKIINSKFETNVSESRTLQIRLPQELNPIREPHILHPGTHLSTNQPLVTDTAREIAGARQYRSIFLGMTEEAVTELFFSHCFADGMVFRRSGTQPQYQLPSDT